MKNIDSLQQLIKKNKYYEKTDISNMSWFTFDDDIIFLREMNAYNIIKNIIPSPNIYDINMNKKQYKMNICDGYNLKYFFKNDDLNNLELILKNIGSVLAKIHEIKPNIEITNMNLKNLYENYKNKLIKYENEELINELNEIYLLFSEEDKNELTFIHGDFHGENMIINKNYEITGIIDWEENILGNRYFDIFAILNYIMYMLKLSNNESEYEKLKDKFIEGYGNIDYNKILLIKELVILRNKIINFWLINESKNRTIKTNINNWIN
jgi:thiamine kinase-like enzyme